MTGINTVQTSATRIADTLLSSGPKSIANELLAGSRTLGGTDMATLGRSLDQLQSTNPALASQVRSELNSMLSPVEQGQLAATAQLSQPTLVASAPGNAARGLSKLQTDLILDVTQIGLDIVGIFEPTPFADGANTLISLGRGDWFGAITSAAGIIPYVGDAAKLGKLGRWAETIAKAVDLAATNPAFRRAIEPTLRKISDAIDSVGLNRLPESVRNHFSAIKSKIDNLLGVQPRQVSVATRHAAGNSQVIVDGQRWHLPAGKTADDIPRVDPVGDRLQALATDAASRWSPSRLSANERAAIAEARRTGEHWRANLLQAQAKGRWIEDQVRTAAAAENLPLQWSRVGLDATDLRNGTKYDVMSGTQSNLDTHAKREPNQLFRMITF